MNRRVLLQISRFQFFPVPNAGCAQGREVETLSIVVKIERRDEAFSWLFLIQTKLQLLLSLRPGHDQHVVFAWQQSEEEILRRNAKRVRRRVCGGIEYQVVADKAGHDAILNRAQQADALHIRNRLDLHNLRLAEGEDRGHIRCSLDGKEDFQRNFVIRIAHYLAATDPHRLRLRLQRGEFEDFPAETDVGW